MNYARDALGDDPKFVFVRRIVTRSPDAGSEDHDSLTPLAFEADVRVGNFSLHWDAHGLRYGLPASIRADIADGRVVIANISRQSIEIAQAEFERLAIISLVAPRAVLAKRLLARGRESAAEIEARLSRNTQTVSGPLVTEICNDGALADAGDTLLRTLRGLA